jgi:hypothetical protein
MAISISDKNPRLDEKITVSVAPGDLGSGKPLVDPGGGWVDWGDGSSRSNFPKLQNGTYEHSYSKTGSFPVTVSATGQFKWNADDGSCSFYCTAKKADTVTVGVKVLSQEDMKKLLESAHTPDSADLLQRMQNKETVKSGNQKVQNKQQ